MKELNGKFGDLLWHTGMFLKRASETMGVPALQGTESNSTNGKVTAVSISFCCKGCECIQVKYCPPN